MHCNKNLIAIVLYCALCSIAWADTHEHATSQTAAATSGTLTLDDCIQIAFKNHQSLNVSDADVVMAEALYQQAMSAYWPHLNAEANAQHADQDRTFNFQGDIDGQAISNALSKSSPLFTQIFQSGLAQPIGNIPLNVKTKLFDRDIATARVSINYPIFTGGKIAGLVGQAEKGVKIAEEGRRKTRLEIINDVKKYYFGAQFAQQMQQLSSDTLERFQALEDLTERLYQHGSMKVKKTDYLRTKTITAMTRSLLREAQYATELAHEALGNAMGIEWNAALNLAELPEPAELNKDLASLLHSAQEFNPDLQQLNLAIQASDDMITEARSAYYPMIGFQAEAYKVFNNYAQGLINSDNRDGWTLSIGLNWSLFDGFLTAGKVKHAQAQQRKYESQKILLDKGTAVLIKQQFLRIKSAHEQLKDTQAASGFAGDNRNLNVSAYQEEMVETKDVIEAQLLETFAQSAYFRSRYALNSALASLEFLVGSHIDEINQ